LRVLDIGADEELKQAIGQVTGRIALPVLNRRPCQDSPYWKQAPFKSLLYLTPFILAVPSWRDARYLCDGHAYPLRTDPILVKTITKETNFPIGPASCSVRTRTAW